MSTPLTPPLAAFACGYPGCARTFGVRSNAKRHMRTHGMHPPFADAGASANGAPAYVVGFQPPVILPSAPHDYDYDAPGPNPAPNPSAGEGADADTTAPRPPRQFKVRWMPSVTSGSGAEAEVGTARAAAGFFDPASAAPSTPTHADVHPAFGHRRLALPVRGGMELTHGGGDGAHGAYLDDMHHPP